MADLHLGTDAEVDAFEALEGVEVIPELGFGEHDELSVIVGIFTTPEIKETGEGAGLVGKGDAPNASELNAGISTGGVVALEVLLVHKLNRVGLGEVSTVSVPCRTNEG